jgi:hypothetical protein
MMSAKGAAIGRAHGILIAAITLINNPNNTDESLQRLVPSLCPPSICGCITEAQGVGVIGTQDAGLVRDKDLVEPHRLRRVPRLSDSPGKVAATDQGGGMVGTEHPQLVGEDRLGCGGGNGRTAQLQIVTY